jgi:hypothetical protein
MKRRFRRIPLFKQLLAGYDRICCHAVNGPVSRQHQLLLLVGAFLLLCSVAGSIWLINVQQRGQGSEEVLESQAAIVGIFSAERVTRREI